MSTIDEAWAFDRDGEVDQGVFDAYLARGFTKLEKGAVVKDRAALEDAAYEVVRHQAVVTSNEERLSKAVTKEVLCAKVFPAVRGAAEGAWDGLTEVQQGVWKTLSRDVWTTTNPHYTGPIQTRLEERDGSEKLILIREKLSIGMDPSDAVYVTSNEDLIRGHFTKPLNYAVRKAAENMGKNLAMVSRRKPEMRDLLAKELDSGMKAATNLAKVYMT